MVHRVVYVDGLDAETTLSMVSAYAEEWGGELSDAATFMYPGCARVVFVEERSAARFLRQAHYLNDHPIDVYEAPEEDRPWLDRPCPPTDIPLDDVFWVMCDSLLYLPVEDFETSAPYLATRTRVLQQAACNEQRPTPFSMAYAQIWGPLTPEDLDMGYPDGICYHPETDRVFFRDIDCLVYGLQQWYRAAQRLQPHHAWLAQRRQTFDQVVSKMELNLDMDDVASIFSTSCHVA